MLLSSLSVTWRWKDIGCCAELGILSKLLRPFRPLNPTGSPSLWLGPKVHLCSQSCGYPEEVWEETKNQFFFCFSLYLFIFSFFFFLIFWPCPAACGILVPRPGMQPEPPAVEAWSLNHWTTREVPLCIYCASAESVDISCLLPRWEPARVRAHVHVTSQPATK